LAPRSIASRGFPNSSTACAPILHWRVRHWEHPDKYDITRRTVGHVGFGSGIHQCVGQLLARLEGECVFSALARKAGSLEITGPPRRRYNNTLRALASLPVTMRPAKPSS
jgi:cytochrome P450